MCNQEAVSLVVGSQIRSCSNHNQPFYEAAMVSRDSHEEEEMLKEVMDNHEAEEKRWYKKEFFSGQEWPVSSR